MLTIQGARQRFCDGITRRDFLKVGALSGALDLPDLLRLQAHGAQAGRPSPRAVIMVCLNGGPSHVDMYDLKLCHVLGTHFSIRELLMPLSPDIGH